jgi:hypothetical protein
MALVARIVTVIGNGLVVGASTNVLCWSSVVSTVALGPKSGDVGLVGGLLHRVVIGVVTGLQLLVRGGPVHGVVGVRDLRSRLIVVRGWVVGGVGLQNEQS